MITLQLIRGHRLKLFADRLYLKPEFVKRIDIHGMNYVQSVTAFEGAPDYLRLVVLVKVIDQDMPLPVTFVVHYLLMAAIVEKFELEGEEVDDISAIE